MSLPANVQIISVTEGVRFPLGGTAIRTTVYKYTVGTDGPFTLEFDAGTDTTQAVSDAINAKANSIAVLRAGA